jgi:zinc protease
VQIMVFSISSPTLFSSPQVIPKGRQGRGISDSTQMINLVSPPIDPTGRDKAPPTSDSFSPVANPNSTPKPDLSPQLKALGIQKTGEYTLANGNPVSQYRLANGHQVVFEQRKDDLASLRTFIRMGSSDENAVFKSPLYTDTGYGSGIAHLDEHCHFLTTKNYPGRNEWVGQIENYGVSLNASTSDEAVQHELHFNREDLPTMLQLHAEQVLHPKYQETFIDQERKNVLNEASERLESSTLRLMDKGFELMFDRPISYQTLGNRDDVNRTSAKDLERFFKATYTPTNMVTVLSADVDPTLVLPLINKEFGHPAPQPAPVNTNGLKWALAPDEVREQTYTDPKLSGLSLVMLGFKGTTKDNSKERATEEIIENYLTAGDLAPLNRHLVDEQHLAMDVSMISSAQKKTGMSMFVMHSFEGHEQDAANALMKEVQSLGKEPISAERLEKAKTMLSHQKKMSLRHSDDSSYAIGDEALNGSMDYLANYSQYINSITPNDIQQYANKYLNGDSYALVYALPGRDHLESDKVSSKSGVLPSFVPQAGPASMKRKPVVRNPSLKKEPLIVPSKTIRNPEETPPLSPDTKEPPIRVPIVPVLNGQVKSPNEVTH